MLGEGNPTCRVLGTRVSALAWTQTPISLLYVGDSLCVLVCRMHRYTSANVTLLAGCGHPEPTNCQQVMSPGFLVGGRSG